MRYYFLVAELMFVTLERVIVAELMLVTLERVIVAHKHSTTKR